MKLNTRKLEAERKRLNMAKAEFSRRLGFDVTSYGKIIKNQSTTMKTLTAIAKALNLDPRDLLTI